jgi:hypothetical protein
MVYRRSATASEVVSEFLRRKGVEVSALRLDETVAAHRERDKIENAEFQRSVRAAASAVVKARRAEQLAVAAWRGNQTPATMAHYSSCHAAHKSLRGELEELLLNDADLVAAALEAAASL